MRNTHGAGTHISAPPALGAVQPPAGTATAKSVPIGKGSARSSRGSVL
jgi:hypothetical protein